jgi:putative transposase
MPSALRFRLYPNYGQEAKMLRALEASRRLWNDALAHRKARWENERKSTSYNLQQWILTEVRHTDPLISGALHSQSAQDVLRRLDLAFQAFFERRARYPKFKKCSSAGSFTYPQCYNGSVKLDAVRKRAYLSKVGNVRVVLHRPLPNDARLKTCTVTREQDGKWFVSLVFEQVVPLQNIDARSVALPKTSVGVDLGLLSLITTSDDEKVAHPHFLRKAEKRLKHLQHTLSSKKKGSKNHFKARHRVSSYHARVRRQRLDFNHKLSTRLVREHNFVAFEDLKIRNMIRNHRLAKSISDAAWGQLVKLTEYKARNAGSRVVLVPATYSTQECHHCGTVNKTDLSVREFVCIKCSRLLQRDSNAARVVLKRGLAIAGLAATKVGQDMPEFKPVKTKPLLLQTTGGVSRVSEAGTICAFKALEAHGT